MEAKLKKCNESACTGLWKTGAGISFKTQLLISPILFLNGRSHLFHAAYTAEHAVDLLVFQLARIHTLRS